VSPLGPPKRAPQATIQAVQEPSGNSPAYVIEASAPLEQLLGPSARACMDDGGREGCNAVANLCALQLYSACVASLRGGGGVVAWAGATAALPADCWMPAVHAPLT
jgi:hypothetical protein